MPPTPVPGPWYVESRVGAVPKWGVYAMSRGQRRPIAAFVPTRPTAQLIAAAPALLDACQEALLFIKENAAAAANSGDGVEDLLKAAIVAATVP